jgi:hypothetical protein
MKTVTFDQPLQAAVKTIANVIVVITIVLSVIL